MRPVRQPTYESMQVETAPHKADSLQKEICIPELFYHASWYQVYLAQGGLGAALVPLRRLLGGQPLPLQPLEQLLHLGVDLRMEQANDIGRHREVVRNQGLCAESTERHR